MDSLNEIDRPGVEAHNFGRLVKKGFTMTIHQPELGIKQIAFALIARAISELELTPTQENIARQRYEGVGNWLAAGADPILARLGIYVQGSTALGTTVRPLGRNEFDVDLVAHRASTSPVGPAELKKAIGDRLRENGHYEPLLEEMPRCWRLNYAGEFHMDITPSIPNSNCGNGGELVPDRQVQWWKPSNPKGYKALFERRAKLEPRFTLLKRAIVDGQFASVEPYPANEGPKGHLRRIVQIVKRHRDIHFANRDTCLAPISVILTTLAAQSYEMCVARFVYESEFDLLVDVVRHMTDFIEHRAGERGIEWLIWNETTAGENFAEKWNRHPERADSFFAWHRAILADLEALTRVEGLDRISLRIGDAFGQDQAKKAVAKMTDEMTAARRSGGLGYAPAVGLGIAAVAATPVRANTYFGRPER